MCSIERLRFIWFPPPVISDAGANDAHPAHTPRRFLIIPATKSSKEDTDKVSTDILTKTKDNHPIFSKSDDNLGVLFWVALLITSDADQLKANRPIVSVTAPFAWIDTD